MNRWILILWCVVFLGSYSQAGDSLLYCVRTSEIKASQVPSKTDIFAVDPETGKQRLVFSDAHSEFLLLPGSDAQIDVLAGGPRIFSRAMDRKLYAKDPAFSPAALYELSANGSGKARKIFDIPIEDGMGSNVRMLFVSPTGAKIGYIRTSQGKQYLFLHETSTGKLLRKLDLTENMGNMSVTTIGWMPDETRLFFTLNRTDEDDEWTNPDSLMGSYVMKEDGTGRERIAPEEQMHPSLPGLNKDVKVSAILLGVLPDGRYLLRDVLMGPPSAHPGTYVYILASGCCSDQAKKVQKIFPLEMPGELHPFRLSHSTNELAVVATQHKFGPGNASADSKTFWIFDVESGKQRNLLSFTAKQDSSNWIGLIGWRNSR